MLSKETREMSDLEEIKELQAMLKEDSSNFQARRRLAILLLDSGFSEDALKQLSFLIGIFPADASLYYNLGIVYEKLKKLDLAEKAYLKAIEISPNETDFYYNLGLVYIDKAQYDKAIESFNTVLKTDTDDANSYFNLGLCYTKKGEEAPAIDYLNKAVELNDNDVFAHFYLGNHFKNQGKIDLAIEKYNKVLKLCPDYSWAYFNLGSIAFEEGDFDEAIINLKKTLEFNPRDIEAYKIYSKILIKLDMLKEAQELIHNAIKENQYEADLFYILAQIYKAENDSQGYEKALNIALKNYKSLSFSVKEVKKELDEFMSHQPKNK